MELSELINLAKYSELNTLGVKDNNEAIVGFINLGLVELYTLFPVRTEEHIIELEDAVTVYDLPADFMYLVGAYEVPEQVHKHDNAVCVAVNEQDNPLSINTINYKQVQIPLSITGAYISIIYVPKPAKMTVSDLTAEVPIPDQLVQCLLNFVGYKGHSAITSEGQSAGDVYFARFKRACDEAKRLGIAIAAEGLTMPTRHQQRGFP